MWTLRPPMSRTWTSITPVSAPPSELTSIPTLRMLAIFHRAKWPDRYKTHLVQRTFAAFFPDGPIEISNQFLQIPHGFRNRNLGIEGGEKTGADSLSDRVDGTSCKGFCQLDSGRKELSDTALHLSSRVALIRVDENLQHDPKLTEESVGCLQAARDQILQLLRVPFDNHVGDALPIDQG